MYYGLTEGAERKLVTELGGEAGRGTVLGALVTAPVTVAARAALPRLRPSIEVVAHRHG